jgi:hypothetical protein
MHTASELQNSLGIPVLVSVPRIMLESDRAARSRQTLRESLAAVAVVIFVLFGGIATYVVVNGGGDTEAVEVLPTTEARTASGIGRG